MHDEAAALARDCVAELLHVHPGTITVAQSCTSCGGTDHGRPFVTGRPDVGVSWSHSLDHIAAVAAFGPCGIDVEGALAGPAPRRALTAEESAWVRDGADFVRLWTRKEAVVKAGAAVLDDVGSLDVLSGQVEGLELTTWVDDTATVSVAILPGSVKVHHVRGRAAVLSDSVMSTTN